MKAVTVRQLDGTLLCFGPDNGMYNPGYDPATSTKQVETDYDAIVTEWTQRPVVETEGVRAKRQLYSAKTVADLALLLEKIL